MSNSQGQRREIISTPEPAPKRQRTSRNTSKNIANIPRETRPRVTRSPRTVEPAEPTRVIDSAERLSDPLEDRPEKGVETAEPAAGVIDSSARSSDPLGYQAATPGRDPEEAAIEDARVMSSPARVNDTSERSSQPEDRQLTATSWILPEVPTSTGVDTGAMPTKSTDRQTGLET